MKKFQNFPQTIICQDAGLPYPVTEVNQFCPVWIDWRIPAFGGGAAKLASRGTRLMISSKSMHEVGSYRRAHNYVIRKAIIG